MSDQPQEWPPAKKLLHEWNKFTAAREAMRRQLPPNIPPDQMVQVLMLDVMQMARFMTQTLAYLEQQERAQIVKGN